MYLSPNAEWMLGYGRSKCSMSFELFVLGHYGYFRTWMPVTGELLPVKREISNNHDPFAVVIWKDGEVAGHVPRSLRKITSFLLNYDGNIIFCEVVGQ